MQVFDRFIVSLFTEHHVFSLSSSSVILFCKITGLVAEINRQVSSANNRGVLLIALFRSFTYIKNRSGPREDPWGTP